MEMRGCLLQTTNLTPRCLGLEVCLHGPSTFTERGGQKRLLHLNCWGEVWRHAEHFVVLLEFTYPSQLSQRGELEMRVPPVGLEPTHLASEASTLSAELQGHVCRIYQVAVLRASST